MRKRGRFDSLLCAIVIVVMAALIDAAGSAAQAQQPQTAGPVSLGDLFRDDSVDLRDGAEAKLRDAGARTLNFGGCAIKAKFKVMMKPGDPLFQKALADARVEVIKARLADSPFSSRFEFSGEMGSRDEVQVDYERVPDREKPKLDTNSVPRKGSKVKPNDRIIVTMVARDDSTTWQTGIQRIQLVAQNSGGEVLVGAQDYPPVIRANCEGRPEPRTLVITYTVPRNPPPVVRLRGIAEDFANNHDTDTGEFPTGDWYGHIDWRIPFPSGRLWGRLDVTFDYDGQGNLEGRMAGDSHVETQPRGVFCGMTTQTPAKNSANLVGQYTPGTNAMSLRVANPQIEPGQFSMCAIGPDGGPLPMSGQPFEGSGPIGQPGLAQLLNSFTVRADGSVEASGEWPVSPASPTPMTLHMKLTLHRAQN